MDWLDRIQTYFTRLTVDPVHHVLYPIIAMIIIILGTYLAAYLINRAIERIFQFFAPPNSARMDTLKKLAHSIARYLTYFFSAVLVLNNLGFNTTPILAGMSFLGLVTAFGTQNLIKDFFTGFFLLFEHQLAVGDNVTINGPNDGIQGTVEEIGLRITKIREFNQRLHYLANGTIQQVTNASRKQMMAMASVNVPPYADLNAVREALTQATNDMYDCFGAWLLEKPEVLGVTKADTNGIQVTIAALTTPERVWRLECRLREVAINALQDHQIPWFAQGFPLPNKDTPSAFNTAITSTTGIFPTAITTHNPHPKTPLEH
ncbi:mechanosensitive ion channel family protein [Pasteuria penetrans]|uniref:mechanosensitive ion channel family protein n=1 Tax=Pasteuria penetrans TaxID=86005 RepID=UPI000FB99642|nr:mechanosensitive ion channel domain-containing protein [Pasteuria penetrans]